MDRDTILTTISEESWEQIKISMNDKKIFFINDLDRNEIFLIYI